MKMVNMLPLVTVVRLVAAQMDPSAPGCAVRCWENTQYVSKCFGDTACLCREENYQSSVYQCLYSQCDTAHFGSALHYTMSRCFGTGNEILLVAPPTPDGDALRRREEDYAAGGHIYGSGSADGYPRGSVNLPTQSANNPTFSMNFPTQSAGGPYSPSATSPLPAYAALEAPSLPAITSATPTEPMNNINTASSPSEPQPQMFLGKSLRLVPFSIFSMFIIIAVQFPIL